MSDAPPNRLARESSPYLLLHAHNPVDWFPWGEEALARARAEDKPIFLSVGYSTCYWCHVMERESFSAPAIAEVMNRELVSIKVDREERPEIDEIYMTATQILTGRGGWPNSVFLTPDLRPFLAGTYYPPEDRGGQPGFASLVAAVGEAWRERRAEIDAQADEVSFLIRRYLESRAAEEGELPARQTAVRSIEALERRYDSAWGGFGSAPKFPTPSNLWLLRDFAGQRPRAAEMLHHTLDQMARGGIFDQLGGGFHRYATDREWKVPHFEKMLYDNALLLELYAQEHQRTGDLEPARVTRETVEFLAREMTGPQGELWSAIDAETDGEEGAFYVWKRDQLFTALGPEDAAFLAPLLGFDGAPFFEGRYVLHLPRPMAEQAERRRIEVADLWRQVDPLRRRLLAARDARERPRTDDKVLADWNGLGIAGLATAGRLLGEPAWIERAERAAAFVLERLRPAGGPLLHVWRDGVAKVPAFLADYAYLVRGLLALDQASADRRWLAAARELAREQEERLGGGDGGYFAAAASPDLLYRTQEIFDGATPAPNAVAALNLLTLAERTGDVAYRERAAALLRAFGPLVSDQVEAARAMMLVIRRLASQEGESAAPRGVLDQEARAVVEARLALDPGKRGDWERFHLRLRIEPGWHVQSHPASRAELVPTSVQGDGVELRGLVYPPAQKLAEGASGWAGEVEIAGECRRSAPRGSLTLRYQACDESRCLPPVAIDLPLA
jgi:uncharacterized protein YyaL (SSP411 family)